MLVLPGIPGRRRKTAMDLRIKASIALLALVLCAALGLRDAGAQTQQLATGAFCGISDPTPGTICYGSPAICGYAAAKSICVAVCSTRTAHMCTTSEIALNAQSLTLPPG